MTPPVSGGVPEQGLRDEILSFLDDSADVYNSDTGDSDGGRPGDLARRLRALERPRPALPMADGPIHTYWHRRRDADTHHGQVTGCLCNACQNERGYYLTGESPPALPPLESWHKHECRGSSTDSKAHDPCFCVCGATSTDRGKSWTYVVGAALPAEHALPQCDHCKGRMELIWVCDHGHPVVYRLARSAGLELGEIQEWGEELGLLTKVVASAPCGEGCVCADYVGDDFPTDCYRPTFGRTPEGT